MKILLTGATGGIGSAIKDALREHDISEYHQEMDWLIFAHGIIDESDVGRTFAVNTLTCLQRTQDYLPNIKKGVIYISSTSAMTANSRLPVYSASKAALNTYARAMAKAHPNLQFYALCPGATNTKMWRNLKLEGTAQDPSEVAKAVKRIIEGEFTSGDIITVRDGVVSV